MFDSFIILFFIYHSYMFILNILQYDIYTFIQLFITDCIYVHLRKFPRIVTTI